MKYRNRKTGFVMETGCEVSGEFWEAIKPPRQQKAEEEQQPKPKTTTAKKPARKTTKKTAKGG